MRNFSNVTKCGGLCKPSQRAFYVVNAIRIRFYHHSDRTLCVALQPMSRMRLSASLSSVSLPMQGHIKNWD